MRTNVTGSAFLLFAILTASLRGQVVPRDADPQTRVVLNGERLRVSLELDRRDYFPGEVVELIITVENPTADALEVYTPFAPETFMIGLAERNNQRAKAMGVEYGSLRGHTFSLDAANLDLPPRKLPTTVMPAGAKVTKRLRSYDQELTEGNYVIEPGGSAPSWAGQFRLGYWNGIVDFRVVMPVFEGIVKIPLSEWEVPRAGLDVGKRLRQSAYAFVLAYEGKHYLCLEHVPFSGRLDPVHTDTDGRLVDYAGLFGRYSRIAESETPIESLKGESDSDGNLTLTWGKAGEHRLFLRQEEWRIRDHNLGR